MELVALLGRSSSGGISQLQLASQSAAASSCSLFMIVIFNCDTSSSYINIIFTVRYAEFGD